MYAVKNSSAIHQLLKCTITAQSTQSTEKGQLFPEEEDILQRVHPEQKLPVTLPDLDCVWTEQHKKDQLTSKLIMSEHTEHKCRGFLF